jgi:nitrate/nitrite-specific signal transduction histidine kinase
MIQPTALSPEELLDRLDLLTRDLESLQADKLDLEIVVDTITEHSTDLENEIYEKNQTLLKYIEQVKKVTAAAAAVERDAFDPRLLDGVAARDDELGQLARVFQNMAERVKVREEKLKKQVEELRIEIDTTRQAKQVAEIVQTDSFKNLKDKLKRMKAARSTV